MKKLVCVAQTHIELIYGRGNIAKLRLGRTFSSGSLINLKINLTLKILRKSTAGLQVNCMPKCLILGRIKNWNRNMNWPDNLADKFILCNE